MTGSPSRAGCTISYLCAHFGKSQLWHTSGLLFAFFLTQACGLTPRVTGWVLSSTLIFNGLVDLFVGRWTNGRICDATAAVRMQARAALAVAACFVLFAATPLVPPGWRPGWALATLGGFRLLYPLVDVAQNGLVPLMTGDGPRQRRLLAARNIVSSLAALAVAFLAAPLLIHRQPPSVYLLWSAAVAGLMAVSSASLARATWSTKPMPVVPMGTTGARRDFPVVLFALAVMMIATTLFRTMEPYFAAFASRRIDILLWGAVGAMISQPLWVLAIGRQGMARALVGMAAMLVLAALLLTGPVRTTGLGMMVVGIVFGAGTSGLWLALWAMMTERAVPGRALSYVGTFTCMSKLAQGAGVLLVARVLARTPDGATTLSDPSSLPSGAMVMALAVMAAVALALAAYGWGISRTGSGGTAARPPRPVRSIPVPDRPRPAA